MTTKDTCASCGDASCTAKGKKPDEKEEAFLERQALASRLCKIGHRIMVLSGKGGVGKSTVAVNLAAALAAAGKRVGLLDIDIHGPSIPKLLHLEGARPSGGDHTLYPLPVEDAAGQLSVMSIGLLLPEPDSPVIWRGPMKYTVIKQFLKDVEWGELDYLIVDAPPGTGDEPLAVAQIIDSAVSFSSRPPPAAGLPTDGAVIVTTPQQVAVQDVRRSILFCRQVGLPVLGVVENMSGFVCPHCGERTPIFGDGGGQAMATELGVPFLGSVPIDPTVMASGESGMPLVTCYPSSPTARAFGHILQALLGPDEVKLPQPPSLPLPGAGGRLRVAVPLVGGRLAPQLGRCEAFAFFDIEPGTRSVQGPEIVASPSCEPGRLSRWLLEHGVQVMITSGLGVAAQRLFSKSGITAVAGASIGDPAAAVRAYLESAVREGSEP